MMSNYKTNQTKYFQILELEENASLADINQAYKKLKELYSSESIVTDAIEDEFTQEDRQEVLNEIEEAYKALVCYMVEKDRVGKEVEKKEEALADTAKEEDEKKEEVREAPEEEEEESVLELEEEVRIANHELPMDVTTREAFSTIPAPADLPEEIEGTHPDGTQVYVYENETEHEHVHIELPDKEEIAEIEEIKGAAPPPQEDAFELTSDDEDEEFDMDEADEDIYLPTRRDKSESVWDESIFVKDVKDIKKEITKDIKNEVTFVQKKPGDELEKTEFEGLEIKGRTLRKIREKLGFGIHEIAVASKINYKILVNIEKERFSKLPDAGHLRWYLITYAKALFLDPHMVADEYMKRYRQWKRQKGEE